MKKGHCRLCLQYKDLINKSHILSNFFYKDVFNKNSEGYLVSLTKEHKGRKVTTGEFEGGILCENCENVLLGSYENYGSGLIFGKSSDKDFHRAQAQNQLHPDGKLRSIHIVDLSYQKTKLFLLSLLWRSSVSTRPFFKQVQLGKYEEQIRIMLLTGNPGVQMQFPCFVGIISDHVGKISEQIISSPTKFRKRYCISYQFQIGNGKDPIF